MDKKFAIFDMDGTLTDSMGFWENAAGEYLLSCGVPEEALTPELMMRIKTSTVSDTSRLFVEHFGIQATPELIMTEIERFMKHHYSTDVPLKPGVRDYLEKLRQNNVKMCVASATGAPLIDLCLSRLGVKDYFEFLLSCETVGVGKSRPDVYLTAMRRLGAENPSDVAVYEDALHAAETASAAGFYLVGVYDHCAEAEWPRIQELANEVIMDWTAS